MPLFRALRAWSTCSSAALFDSPVASEISHTRSFLARSSIRLSPGESAFVSLNSVSDSTTAAKSKPNPEMSSFKLSLARGFQFLLVLAVCLS